MNYTYSLTSSDNAHQRSNSVRTIAIANSFIILCLLALNLVFNWECFSCSKKSRFKKKPAQEVRMFKYSRCFLKPRNYLQNIQQEVSISSSVQPILSMNSVTQVYGKCKKVKGIDLTSALFFKGRIHAIFGPNGCGKSTILKIIAKRIDFTQG